MSQSPTPSNHDAASKPLSLATLLPNHRDLYVLAAGLLLGVLLGPAVLGRWSPPTYNRYFMDMTTATTQLAAHDERVRITMEKLVSTKVSSVALEEFNELQADKRQPYLDQMTLASQARGRLVASLLAVLVLMILETLPEAAAIVMRSRLATARYALISLSLAFVIAQPQLLKGLSISFLMLLLLVGLTVAFMPLSGGPPDEPTDA